MSPTPQFVRPNTSVPSPSPIQTPTPGSNLGPRSVNSRGVGYFPHSRPRTPEQYPHSKLQGPRGNRANSDGSQPPAYLHSPEQGHHAHPYHSQTQNHHGEPQRAFYDPRSSARVDPSSHQPPFTPGGVPPRPYSQPTNYGPPGTSAQQDGRSAPAMLGRRGSFENSANDSRKGGDGVHVAKRSQPSTSPEYRDEYNSAKNGEVIKTTSGSHPETGHYHQPSVSGRDATEARYSAWEQSSRQVNVAPSADRQEDTRPDSAHVGISRTPFATAEPHDSATKITLNHPGSPQSHYPPSHSQDSPAPPLYGNGADKRRQNLPQTPDTFGRGSPIVNRRDTQSPYGKGTDDSPNPQQYTTRGLLSINSENNRKGGRISPLPQAVQGAQGQRNAPGGEPGIKREFDRMFSGIGSGVGSAMPTASPNSNGTQTNQISNPTPKKEENGSDGTGADALVDVDKTKSSGTGTRGGRRSRKVKEEERRLDSESGDGRATPGLSKTRGAKRMKHNHHHHYHQHTHHHHHHHHKPEDDLGSTSPVQPRPLQLSTSDNAINMTTPSQNISTTSTPTPHHHHHHHHHHRNKQNTPNSRSVKPASSSRKPITTVVSHPVVDSVAHLPRHHLGSTLYSSRVSPISTTTQSKIGFVTTPHPIPRFEGQENCTLTVRVPQHVLSSESREELVRRRAVWGTDVYTDDSDVLAAAVHSGWVQGAWEGNINASLLNLKHVDVPALDGKDNNPVDQVQKGGASTLHTFPKAAPVSPPVGKDLHVTLLILPALQSYASSVAWGLRSRHWGNNHDGLSFQILKVDWVGAGSGSLEDRSGEARRKRLKGLLRQRNGLEESGRLKGGKPKAARSSMWSIEAVA
ncbi:MAG: hypothetical protein M1837_005853 [Sclerophora amabilis]|nr:MAG: hypothetical protein M1837_005853 [Sclerophora amabilis]